MKKLSQTKRDLVVTRGHNPRTSKNALTRKALLALQSAVAKVVAQHRRDGRPLAVWRNGKAVLVSPGKPLVRETPATYRTRTRRK